MDGAPRLEDVEIEVGARIASIRLNRPEQRNPLSAAMLRDLVSAFRWAADEPKLRVVVLTGAGDSAFCAGADLAGFDAETSALERHRGRQAFVDLFTIMQELGKPILGRVNGHALAGGFGLACACDILVAAEEATFGTPEINVGLWPMMIQAILARNLPRKVLLEMILLGDRWTATQMRDVGLVSRVVSRDQLDRTVDEIAQRLAGKSPEIMRLGRDSFYRQQDLEFRSALEYLRGQLSLATLSDDTREGVRAFFEKREPVWQADRTPE